MSRDMGGGVKAYRLTIGRPVSRNDLVFIFDTAPDLDIVSPEEQRAFFERYRASIGRTEQSGTWVTK
jgi:hypothetical protein